MQKDIEIKSKNYSTHGTLYLHKSKTLVIGCFGWQITRKRIGPKRTTDLLDTNGPSMFIYDPFLYADANFSNKYHPLYEQLVEELGAVVKYFKKNYDFDKIILQGISLGAIISSIGAIQFKGIDALLTLNGCFDVRSKPLTHLVFKYTPVLARNYKNNKNYYFANFKPELIKTPTLIIHGRNDRIVSHHQSEIFFDSLKAPKKIILVDHVNHYLTNPNNIITVRKLMMNWVKENKLL